MDFQNGRIAFEPKSNLELMRILAASREMSVKVSTSKADVDIEASPESEERGMDFQNGRIAFEPKSNLELMRTWAVFQTCAIGPIVRHCDQLYALALKVLGGRLTHWAMRHTFFNHFCAGETRSDILPRMSELQALGVGGILDYAAEAKDEAEHAVDESSTVGAPLSSRKYDYKGEVLCDANAEIFLDAIRAVRDATPNGFAAIKLSGLGNPVLLERMSTCLVEMARLFGRLSDENSDGTAAKATEPFFCMDRSFKISYDSFIQGWQRYFSVGDGEDLREIFQKLDTDRDGFINYLDWSAGMRLSEINSLVRKCLHQGPLYRSALDDEDVELYFNLIGRTRRIIDLAQELDVRVMIDAEWLDIQPAIDHIVLHLQRLYNRGSRPVVFNTYQTYLKGMDTRVVRDLQRSTQEGWHFGAKVVRGAYMVSERKKAQLRGVVSPVCDSYEETEANFHRAIDAVLGHGVGSTAVGAGAGVSVCEPEILVASHNRSSIEFTLRRMEELGKDKDKVYFGQLLGMADHLTFTLGANGYNAYKYVPYGPIDEVVPYLIRRTQENSAILGSAGVQEERRMVTAELARRLSPF